MYACIKVLINVLNGSAVPKQFLFHFAWWTRTRGRCSSRSAYHKFCLHSHFDYTITTPAALVYLLSSMAFFLPA